MGHTFSQYPIPYLSYMGAQFPERAFFIFGMSVTFLAYIPVAFANMGGLLYLRVKNRAIYYLAHFGVIFSLLGLTCLVLLSIFDVVDYNLVHWSLAVAFFTLSLLWELFDTIANSLWLREDKSNYQLKRALVIKGIILFFHMASTLSFVLTSAVVSCDVYLSLINYNICPIDHSISAISQYIVLFFILLYVASLSFLKYEDSILASNEYDEFNRRRKRTAAALAAAAASSSAAAAGSNGSGKGKGQGLGGRGLYGVHPSDSQTRLRSGSVESSDTEDQGRRSSESGRASGRYASGDDAEPPYPPPHQRPSVSSGSFGHRRQSSADASSSSSRRPFIDPAAYPRDPVITDDSIDSPTLTHKRPSISTRSFTRSAYNREAQMEEGIAMGAMQSQPQQNQQGSLRKGKGPADTGSFSRGSRASLDSFHRPSIDSLRGPREGGRSSVDSPIPQEPSAPIITLSIENLEIPRPRRLSFDNVRLPGSAPGPAAPPVVLSSQHRPSIDSSFFNVKPF